MKDKFAKEFEENYSNSVGTDGSTNLTDNGII